MRSKISRLLYGWVLFVILLTACASAAAQPSEPTSKPQQVIVTRVVQGTPQTIIITATPEARPTTMPSGSISITGAGATFPYPLYSRWFYDFAFIDPTVKFNYQSIGSGGGIQQITAKTVDFGASDAILNDQQLQAAPGIQMFPTVAGAEAIVVNLKGPDGKTQLADPINFPYSILADIYLGKIKKWNDPALVAANPNIKFPDKDIIVVHRSDGSGTTYIFTDYLSNISSEWKDTVGKGTSVQWPVGLGGKGNEGVYGTVIQNEGAIGYVELAYAIQNKAVLNYLQNKAGEFVQPSIESTQAAIKDYGTALGDKLAISIVDGPGKATYPIAGYTYILLYMDQQDCLKAQKILDFFKWAYGADGDKDAKDLQYVPLPQDVKSQVNAKLSQITCQGKPITP